MPTFVYLDNFRGFSNSLVPLRRVNWLVGENSTGKTSFLEVLQTLSYPPFWLFEPRFAFAAGHPRHFLDLVSASSKSRSSFTVGALSVTRSTEEPDYGMIVTYSNVDGRAMPKRVSIVEGGTVRTVDGKLWVARKGEAYRSRVKRCDQCGPETDMALRARQHVSLHALNTGFSANEVSEERQGSPLFERCADTLFEGKAITERELKVPYPFRSDFVDLAPIRTKPKRTYDAPQTEFSSEGAHTPYVIRKRLGSKAQADEFQAFLERAGSQSGLFQSVRIKPYGRGPQDPFEVQVVLGKTPLGLENVGYGVSQALPVLVEMFVRPRRTAFTIQQPEVHLHPKAQASFGDIVAELARQDEKRFVIETHSDFAIDRFRLNLREKGDVPSQLLYFDRSENGNSATPIRIGKDGSLPDTQPSGYREFFYNESLALLG
jgi:hypothetical protein